MAPESSFTMSPRSTSRPLYFWNWVLTPHSWDDRCPSMWQSGLLSLCASRITSFFALYFVQLPGWNRFELFPFLVYCCFRIRNFHRLRHRNEFVKQVVMNHRSISFACDVIFTDDSTRCLVDSCASTVHAYLVLESCRVYTLAFQFPQAGSMSSFLTCPFLARLSRLHRNFQSISSSRFWWILCILHLTD